MSIWHVAQVAAVVQLNAAVAIVNIETTSRSPARRAAATSQFAAAPGSQAWPGLGTRGRRSAPSDGAAPASQRPRRARRRRRRAPGRRARSRRRARHRLEVAERGEPGEAERVQLVAGKQRQIGVIGRDHAPARRSEAGSPRESSPAAARTRARGPPLAARRPQLRRTGRRGPDGRRRPISSAQRRAALGAELVASRSARRAHRDATSSERGGGGARRVRSTSCVGVGQRREPGLELRGGG